jgi:probable RNA-binding protein EIF1AD
LLGHYVIVDPTVGLSEKVGGEIVQVLFPKNIKDLRAAGKWPTEFTDTNLLQREDQVQNEEQDNYK